jgi:multidrug transporter EmrE-like cation transporter
MGNRGGGPDLLAGESLAARRDFRYKAERGFTLYMVTIIEIYSVKPASLGGMIGGNMWAIKCTAELLQTSINDGNMDSWTSFLPYAIAGCAIFCAMYSLTFLDKGLREYDALFMVPLFEGSVIVSGALSGMIVLDESSRIEQHEVALYIVGIFVVIFGIIITHHETFSTPIQAAYSSTKG